MWYYDKETGHLGTTVNIKGVGTFCVLVDDLHGMNYYSGTLKDGEIPSGFIPVNRLNVFVELGAKQTIVSVVEK